MNLTYRPVESEQDWKTATDLRNRWWTDQPWTTEELLEAASHIPKEHTPDRFIFSLDGREIAYATLIQAFWYDQPGRYECRVFLDPAVETPELLEATAAIIRDRSVAKGATRIAFWNRTDRPTLSNIVLGWGYEEKQRNPESALNPQEFDPTPYAELRSRIEADGYKVLSFAEAKETYPDWISKAHDLDSKLMADVPLPAPFQPLPYEVFEKSILSPFNDLDFEVVAVYGDDWVAQTALYPNHVNPKLMSTGLTGVLKDHRRKGLALCLKSITIEQARKKGVVRISTDNEEDNPMFQINLKLGFKKQYEWVCYEKNLS